MNSELMPSLTHDEACQAATNLARNAGYSVFPCNTDKSPACPHGFKDASRDPAVVLRLWHRFPGSLIGIATGTISGIAVLDVDPKHPAARAWWEAHHPRLLPTRTFATRSGGLHCYFRHRDGVTNTQSKICSGVDTRGEAGYVICWFAAGFGCFDHAPPAPWPDWVFGELKRPPRPAAAHRSHAAAQNSTEAILRRVANATEGERNGVLYWAANRLRERGTLRADEGALLAAARAAGLTEIEARRTVESAKRLAP
jgi:hypothetical protein